MWNSLPEDIVDAPSMIAFKNRLDKAMQEHMFSLKTPRILRYNWNLEAISNLPSVEKIWSKGQSSQEKYKNRRKAYPGLFFNAEDTILYYIVAFEISEKCKFHENHSYKMRRAIPRALGTHGEL
jgi:hypothetical protein